MAEYMLGGVPEDFTLCSGGVVPCSGVSLPVIRISHFVLTVSIRVDLIYLNVGLCSFVCVQVKDKLGDKYFF